MKESIRELQSKQAEAGQKEATPTIETFDFKAKFAETKAYAKVCYSYLMFFHAKLYLICIYTYTNFSYLCTIG